jgi:DNA primase large subunit
MAKYPFTPEAAKHVQELDLKTTELDNPEYARITKRAQQRIEEAITNAIVTDQTHETEVELFSFPIAVMMVAAAKDSFLKRRYALAEAKRTYNILKQENQQKLTEVTATFNWRIRAARHNTNISKTNPSDFTIHFTDYLRNAGNFHETKWKLVNRTMLNGETHITKDEAARLLQEEVRNHIEKKLQTELDMKLPPTIEKEIEQLKQLLDTKKEKIRQEEMPTESVIEAFPPCMRQLYDMAPSGRHISHIGRFALTSFLINSGMPPETVIEHFRPTSDFSEKMTRYQVEHIAGGKGSRTKYIPPRCETLRTHSLCPGMDETCRRIRHPLTYYKRKLRAMKPQTPKAAK